MEKLQYFQYNGISFRYRFFDRADEVTPIMAGHFHRTVNLSLFEAEWCEPFDACEKRLCRMVGHLGEVMETSEHFIDMEGIGWPTETLVVIENPNNKTGSCVLVTPKPRFS